MSAYKYNPLTSSEIRLVRLHQGSREPLSCELKHVSVEDSPEYDCLSYSWSEGETENQASPIFDFTVNGNSHLQIASNLASFLEHARRTDGITQWFWIDSICINQQDIQERSLQVQRMKDIYASAQNVIVWLGPGSADSATAINLLKRIYSQMEGPTELGHGSVAESQDFRWWTEADLEILGQTITIHEWQAVIPFMSRAWWRRTWVIQEAYLGRSLIFRCGRESIAAAPIWSFLENIWAHSHWAEGLFSSVTGLVSACNSGRTILFMREKGLKPNATGFDLLQSLYHTRPSLVTDHKDKVYGVLGLAWDAKTIVPQPDYSLSVDEVFMSMFQSISEVRKDLDWLMFVSGSYGSSRPTWMPDMGKRAAAVSINTSRFISGYMNNGFRAAGQTKPKLSLTSDIASIDGIVVGEIDGVGPRSGSTDGDHFLQPKSDKSAYGSSEECFDAIWKSIVADQDFEGTEESWRAPDTFGQLFGRRAHEAEETQSDSHIDNFLRSWYLRNRHFRCMGKTIQDWAATARSDAQAAPDLESSYFGFERRIRSATGGRKLCTTHQGYLGLVSDDAMPGDKICIPFGGRMPVVLRPEGSLFGFVGECYVHGLMFGSAFEGGPGSYNEQTFRIC